MSTITAAVVRELGAPLTQHTPAGADPDSVIDVRALLQQGHRDVAVDGMAPVLQPRKGRFGLIDPADAMEARVRPRATPRAA